jgi:hypothetical protein
MGQIAFGVILRPGTVPQIPGGYTRFTTSQSIALGVRGLVGIVARADAGDVNMPKICYSVDDTVRYFGNNNGFAPLIAQALAGGSIAAYCSRAGTGGTAAVLVLNNDTGSPGTPTVTLTAKSAGSRALPVTIRSSVTQPGTFEIVVYEAGVPLETKNVGSVNQASAFIATINAANTGSSYYTAALTGVANDPLSLVTQVAPTTVGTNPTVDATAMANARTALRSFAWFTLIEDSEDPVEHIAGAAFIDQCISDGLRRTAYFGQNIANVTLDTMLTTIATINDPAVGYVTNDFATATGTIAGAQAAARYAGILSTMLTHQTMAGRQIPDATMIPHDLVQSDIIRAQNGGASVFMLDHRRRIVTGKEVNTLVNPALPPVWAEALDAAWQRWGRTVRAFTIVDDVMLSMLDVLFDPDPDARPRQNSIGLNFLLATGQTTLNKYVPDSLTTNTKLLLDPAVAAVAGTYAFKIDPFEDLGGVDTIIVKLNTNQATS